MRFDSDSIIKRKKNEKKMKRIIDIILIVLLYNVILIMLSTLNNVSDISIFGYKYYNITTSSMQPEIKAGDVVIVKKVTEEEIHENDVVTYKMDGTNITHRVVKIENNQGTNEYTTKGDNNNVEDSKKLEYEDINGKLVIVIPKIGKLISFLSRKLIFLTLILIVLILTLFSMQGKEKKKTRKEKKDNEFQKSTEK